MPDGTQNAMIARTLGSLSEVPAKVWDGLANPDGVPFNPFLSHAFLLALEDSGSVCREAGWAPHHILVDRDDQTVGAMPMYLKGNSQGEYIFDHAWADAYQRAGGRYFPKLLSAVPFTPATGRRILGLTSADRMTTASAAMQIAEQTGLSSLHVNFPAAEDRDILDMTGYLIRTGQQFQFKDEGFGDWNGFLGALSSRKRKDLRKERASIGEAGIAIEWITGTDITEAHLDQFWVFYQDTGARKWGTPYLTRAFFSLITEQMSARMLLIMAKRDGATIAGALNFIGGDTLYGRYWGCTAHVPFLHFEVCYYQAIDFALAHGLTFVNAGAQGEHKIARGYTPMATYSAHWIADPGFREAIARYLKAETAQVSEDIGYLSDFTPFKKGE